MVKLWSNGASKVMVAKEACTSTTTNIYQMDLCPNLLRLVMFPLSTKFLHRWYNDPSCSKSFFLILYQIYHLFPRCLTHMKCIHIENIYLNYIYVYIPCFSFIYIWGWQIVVPSLSRPEIHGLDLVQFKQQTSQPGSEDAPAPVSAQGVDLWNTSCGCFLKWWYPHFTSQNEQFL